MCKRYAFIQTNLRSFIYISTPSDLATLNLKNEEKNQSEIFYI